MPRTPILLLFIIVSLLSTLPGVLQSLGGDITVHFRTIQCFSEQFWSGQLYPRWCFDVNAGLGSPVLMFYYPVPYYITALFYPLHWLGLSIGGIYNVGVFFASLISMLAVRKWLLPYGDKIAAACATLYLFLPYRAELLLFRMAYAELWAMAFAPLVFVAARKLVQQEKNATLWLALSAALLLATHVPTAIGVLLAAGIYALMIAPSREALPKLVGQGLGAAAIAAILLVPYALPAWYYNHFVVNGYLTRDMMTWANSFVSITAIMEDNLYLLAFGLALTLLFYLGFTLTLLWKRREMEDPKSAKAWITIGILSLFLMTPLSTPLWDAMDRIATLSFPWRMQMLLALATTALGAIILHRTHSRDPEKPLVGNIAALLMLLVLQNMGVTRVLVPDQAQVAKEEQARAIIYREYRTVWTDDKFFDSEYLFDLSKDTSPTRATPIKGKCAYEVQQWNAKAIRLDVDATTACTLRLQHYYFPNWHAEAECKDVKLSPQISSGLMLADLPQGTYTLTIQPKSLFGVMTDALTQTPESGWSCLKEGCRKEGSGT